MKRKVEETRLQQQKQQLIFVAVQKQLRSKLPQRRRRFQFSAALHSSSDFATEEISCNSSKASVLSINQLPEFRRVCGKEETREECKYAEVEVSESSCVESCSGAVSGKFVPKKLKRNEDFPEKFGQNEVVSKLNIGVSEDSDQTGKSDISAVLSFSGENLNLRDVKAIETNSFDVVSVHSVLRSERTVQKCESREEEFERESGAESKKKLAPFDFDITCSEHFEADEVCCSEDYSSYSDLQSEIFLESSSEFDLSSDCTPSIWFEDSGSQFSEKSTYDESPSPTFQLFVQFSQQFCRSNFPFETNSDDNDGSHDFSVLGLEEEEDKESYRMFRTRERRQVYLHDYAEEYCSTTTYGHLIIQQRLEMVHWIVEQSTAKELQKETMFLGVNILDRFLSKGYFKTKRNLQIAGIACLTLATRIEENQPLNSVRQKMFYIGSNAYSRCEVVAMEWLVQEVLKFQCFLPSMYNFLWFYLKAARATENVEKTVKYLAMLALLGHEQLCYWPSTVASVLVILACAAANREAACYGVSETHSQIKDDHLSECLKSLAWMVKYIS